MLKFSRKDLDVLAEAGHEIAALFQEFEDAQQDFQDRCQTLIDKIDTAKADALQIMDDAANDAEEYHGEKSEKWQESDRGEAYSEWMGRIREVADAMQEAIEPPEVSMPEQPEWVSSIADPDFSEFEY